jgi:multidrug transporter EmrE-like cation transporter
MQNGYFFIAMTVLLTVYGQLVLKWQVGLAGPMPVEASQQVGFILRLLLNPWVLSGLGAAFGASLFWMGAMSKFDISKAYPFMAANFVLVGIAAVWLFGESFSASKAVGIMMICGGLILMART